jgi:DNA mismatch repair ATPase MutS
VLWDIRSAIRVAKWQQRHAPNIEKWFYALAEFDALCSLAGFAYNHPGYAWPEITEEYFHMSGRGLCHPLMKPDVCVPNDIAIDSHPRFMIVTGANMAGKSTFLRTVGVNFVLACAGLPVCASQLRVSPCSLVTSLRTSDSLADGESYFFAELKRLKMMIDRLRAGERLFIILDEILKGTNSVDKQRGSLGLVRRLVALDACGIIATHDLALGGLVDELPDHVSNHRFEADITGDELSFSYTLREGIAENMNASFLMQKMGITV